MTNKEYVSYIWHFKVEDNLDWEFCSGILKQDGAANISTKKLEEKFKQYFIDTMGIAPYSTCPRCGNELLPRQSRYGYFIGCSNYPKCTFMATDKKPYVAEKEDNNEQ